MKREKVRELHVTVVMNVHDIRRLELEDVRTHLMNAAWLGGDVGH